MIKTVMYEGELGELFELEPVPDYLRAMAEALKRGTIKLEFECRPEPVSAFRLCNFYSAT